MSPSERSDAIEEAARAAVARLRELSPELHGCAVLLAGRALASSGDGEAWGRAASALAEAADAAASQPADEVHVGTEDGEALMVRSGELRIVAVSPRTVLSSLLAFDMRTVLRDVVAVHEGSGGDGAEAPGSAGAGAVD